MGRKKELVLCENEQLMDYENILQDIRSLIERAQFQAYKVIDNLRVQTYWQIGERIVRGELEHKERADYGERLIEHLARDLGFKKRQIYWMVQFYRTHPIVSTLSTQLSWSHYKEIMKFSDKQERDFYESQATYSNWSVRELRKQIKNDLYKRALTENKVVTVRPLSIKPVTPESLFKDTYNFEFLNLETAHNENDLEDALLGHIEKVLFEFGFDFALIGRQQRMLIDGQLHAVDLELFHRGIPCIVLVDLKRGKFKAEYAGQMNKYLNYYRENKKYPWEKDPIGLIICENKGREEVHYALGGLEKRIFVAEYRIKLPTERQIREKLKMIK